MRLKVFKILILGIFSFFLLSACADREGFLGVRSTPNEFQTYSGAPLVIPEPSVRLPEPKPGAKGTYQQSPEEEAKAALQ